MFYGINNNFKCEISGSPISPRNPDLQGHGSSIPTVIFGISSPAYTFNPESRPDFALKSLIPNFK